MEITLTYLFGILALTSSFMVLLSAHAVHSIYFLILTFFSTYWILVIFEVDYLATLFIIVYVGAIAMLFLFIVMMINIRKKSINQYFFKDYIYRFFVILLLIIESWLIYQDSFLKSVKNWENFFVFENIDHIHIYSHNVNNINSISYHLYTYYSIAFILLGFLLLISMVGAIVLTLNKNEMDFRKQNINKRKIKSRFVISNKK